MTLKTLVITALTAAASLTSLAHAEGNNGARNYEVTITNITKSMQFTPILAASHNGSVTLFDLGAPASPGLALLAEGGQTAPLEEELAATRLVFDTANSADVLGTPPLLFAGQSVTLRIQARPGRNLLSLAAMLLPTNDTFVALNSVRFPTNGSTTVYAQGYDAGSEPNDEFCSSIPGPTCGGEGGSPDADGEGFVHIASGIQGVADLSAAEYDFNNPVARVVITRVP